MKIRRIVLAALVFVAGIAIGKSLPKIDASAYAGKSKEDAAVALLDAARTQAGSKNWERVAIGRVLYLGGHRTEGQALFDAVLNGKEDWVARMNIARIYCEAGEWAKAKPVFDAYVLANPEDEVEIAEIGAYYLVNGDRATAESLYGRSFQLAPDLSSTLLAAGGYLGVTPRQSVSD